MGFVINKQEKMNAIIMSYVIVDHLFIFKLQHSAGGYSLNDRHSEISEVNLLKSLSVSIRRLLL